MLKHITEYLKLNNPDLTFSTDAINLFIRSKVDTSNSFLIIREFSSYIKCLESDGAIENIPLADPYCLQKLDAMVKNVFQNGLKIKTQ